MPEINSYKDPVEEATIRLGEGVTRITRLEKIALSDEQRLYLKSFERALFNIVPVVNGKVDLNGQQLSYNIRTAREKLVKMRGKDQEGYRAGIEMIENMNKSSFWNFYGQITQR